MTGTLPIEKVLIVAKCIVNIFEEAYKNGKQDVLIVAKCIVNTGIPFPMVPTLCINSSKV